MDTYKVYIKINSSNRIIAVNSSAFLIASGDNKSDWILINEGIGDKYHHAMGNYFDKPLIDDNGCHNYIYKNSVVRETTAEEKATELASFPTPEPTDKERISQLETLVLQLSGVI